MDDRTFGERFASNAIAFAHRRYQSVQQRIKELQWWAGVARAFPASSAYSLPIIEAEIQRLTSR